MPDLTAKLQPYLDAIRDHAGALLRGEYGAMSEERKRDVDLVYTLGKSWGYLEEADQLLQNGQFLTIAGSSHELRGPANGLLAYSRILLTDYIYQDHPTQKQSQIFEQIYLAARRFFMEINDVFHYAQFIAMHPYQSTLEDCDLWQLATRVWMEYFTASLPILFPEHTLAQIGMFLVVDDAIPLIKGDAFYIHQIIQKLLDYGFRYTTQGTVKMVLASLPDTVEVRLECTDAGIATEHLLRLFEPFYQIDPIEPGLGLGLHLAKSYAERMGGRLHCESTLGVGSTLIFTLPIAAD